MKRQFLLDWGGRDQDEFHLRPIRGPLVEFVRHNKAKPKGLTFETNKRGGVVWVKIRITLIEIDNFAVIFYHL